jgi:hypothetical protein
MERNLEVWIQNLEGRKIWNANRSRFFAKRQKRGHEKSGMAESGIWNDFFAKKGKKSEKIELRQSHYVVFFIFVLGFFFFEKKRLGDRSICVSLSHAHY